jgi:hypothetical protein
VHGNSAHCGPTILDIRIATQNSLGEGQFANGELLSDLDDLGSK